LAEAPSILFLEPAWLAPSGGADAEGLSAEIVCDLARLGFRVTVPADPAWHRPLVAGWPKTVRVTTSPPWGRAGWAMWSAWHGLVGGSFDVCLLGDVGPGLAWGLRMMRRLGVFGRLALRARRVPTPGLCRLFVGGGTVVTAASRFVRDQFPDSLRAEVRVVSGVVTRAEADAVMPRAAGGDAERTPVRFGLFIESDAGVSGAREAIAALRTLPPPIRALCKLVVFGGAGREGLARAAAGEAAIALRGPVKAADRPATLAGLDALIVAHATAGLAPPVMILGMLTELPVIVSSGLGLEEWVESGGGMSGQGSENLAAAAQALAQDARMRAQMGAEARRVALAGGVWDTRAFVEGMLGLVVPR